MRGLGYTLIAGAVYLASLVGCSFDRDVQKHADVWKVGKWRAGCALQYSNKKEFEMKCFFDDGRRAEMPHCNFPSADQSDVVPESHYPYRSQFATYRGKAALQRAKKDFDDCKCLDVIVLHGDSFKDSKPVSPWTLKLMTQAEKKRMANLFDEQVVSEY